MKIHNLGLLSLTTIATLSLTFLTENLANASTLFNEWYYTTDSPSDSIPGTQVDLTKYEIYNMAFKQTADQIFIAINSNLSLDGTSAEYAHDQHIAWGDLLFNFSGQNLDSANGDLFGIRFADNNESGVKKLGVYTNVTAKAIAKENGLLLENLADYIDWVSKNGGNPSFGDVGVNEPYFNKSVHIPNVIASGTKIGNVDLLNAETLSQLGLNFAPFNGIGSHTFGLSFNRSLLPIGNFVAHLAPECDNDAIALKQELKRVPESSNIVGLVAIGLIISRVNGRKSKKDSAIALT